MKMTLQRGVWMLFACSIVLTGVGRAEIASLDEMERVCKNWLAYVVREQGDWAGVTDPMITDVHQLTDRGRILGRIFDIYPTGFIAIPIIKELPPIKAYSDVTQIDLSRKGGLPQLLRETLGRSTQIFIDKYGSLEQTRSRHETTIFGWEHYDAWERHLGSQEEYLEYIANNQHRFETVGPLLGEMRWRQGPPFNNFCPVGSTGQRCPPGCITITVAQIMKYYNWPPHSFGE